MATSVVSQLFGQPPASEDGMNIADLVGISPFSVVMAALTDAAEYRTALDVPSTTVYDVKHRGALGNGTANDWQFIQDAIDEAISDGGGVVYIPPGVYLIDPGVALSTSTSTYRQCAFAIGSGNVVIRGAGRGATTIKLAEGGIYGAFQFMALPLANGASTIANCALMDMTVDGNYFGTNQSGLIGLVHGSGTKDWLTTNVHLKNHGHYGFAAQNGGNVGLTLSNFVIENTMRDAIDIKNNPSVNDGVTPSIGAAVKILSGTVRNVCKGDDGSSNSMGMVDVMSPGLIVNDVHVEQMPVAGAVTPNVDAVFRVKQGQDGDPSGRGTGGQYAVLSNITVNVQTGASTVPKGISANAPHISIIGAKVRGATSEAGIAMLQPFCSVMGSTISGSAGAGIKARALAGTPLDPAIDAWPYAGADDVTIIGNTVIDCATGIMTQRARTHVEGNFIIDNDLGFHGDTAGASDLVVVGNSFSGNTTNYTLDVNNGHTFFDNPGTDGPRRLILTTAGSAATAIHAAKTAHRFQTGYDGTVASLKDALRIEDVASAVNYWRLLGSATAGALQLIAAGTDTDIDMLLVPKGAGIVDLDGAALVRGDQLLFGGKTSSQAMLKRSTTQLLCRLADDSGYAAFDAASFRVAGTKVVGARETGWETPSGTADKTTFATSTVTLEELAKRTKAIIDALRVHGLIGA